MVAYNDKTSEIFVIKSNDQSSSSDGDCFVYNIIIDAWTFGKKKFHCGTTRLTNVQPIGDNRTAGFFYDLAFGLPPEEDGSPL